MSLLEDTMLNIVSWGDGESVLGSTDMIHLCRAIVWWHFILCVMENWCSKNRYLCCGNYWNVSHAIDWKISIKISTDGTFSGRVLRAAGSGQSPPIFTVPRVNTFKSRALKQTVSALPCLLVFGWLLTKRNEIFNQVSSLTANPHKPSSMISNSFTQVL